MAQTAKSVILGLFEAGDRPTDQDFLNLFDSILFLNNVGSHNNGLTTANTSIEGNFTVGNNLNIEGSGVLNLSGSVSIGNPVESVTSRLHVYNSDSNPVIFASGSTSNIVFSGISGDSTSSIKLQDPVNFAEFGTHSGKAFIGTAGDEYFHISASATGPVSFFSGSVGIGTVSPAYTLDLGEEASTIRLVSEDDGTAIRIGAGGSSNDVTLLRVDGASTNANGTSDSAEFGFSLKYMGSRAGNNNSFSIFSDNQTGTAIEALTILQDGKIGIGVATPTNHLHVENGADTLALFKSTDAGPTYIRIDTSAADSDTSAAVLYMENGGIKGASGYNASSDTMAFLYATGPDSTKGINIDSDGKVGIGTQSPSNQLHVKDTSDDAFIRIETDKTDGRAGLVYENDVQTYTTEISGITDSFLIFDVTATTVPFKVEPATPTNTLYLDSNGRVGILDSAPSYTLDVSGSINSHIGGTTQDNSNGAYHLGNRTDMGMFAASYSVQVMAPSDVILMIDSNANEDTSKFEVRKHSSTVGGGDELFTVNQDGNVSASGIFTGDGSGLTNIDVTQIPLLFSSSLGSDNEVVTATGANNLQSEPHFTFNGEDLRLSGSLSIGKGSAGLFTPDAPLHIKHNGDSLGSQDLIHLSMQSLTTEGSIAIKFSDAGDPINQNFKITYGEGNNDLNFHSDSVNHILYLEDGGNVGIGTDSPGSKLEVKGDIAVRNAADNANVVLIKNADNIVSDSDIIFSENGGLAANSGLHMFTNTDGGPDKFAVYHGGLGTDNASEMFTVQSGSYGLGVRFTQEISRQAKQIMFGPNDFDDPVGTGLGNQDSARIKFTDKNTGGSHYIALDNEFLVFEKLDHNAANPDGGILFTNTGNDGTEEIAMAIRGDGKIGLQEISPTARLHIKNDSSEQSILVESDTKADAFRLHRTNGANININFTNTDDTTGYFIGMSSGEKFAIGKNANLVTDPLLTVDSSHITMFGDESAVSGDGGMIFSVTHNATGPSNLPTSEFTGDSDVTTHLIQFSPATDNTDPGLIAHQSRGTTDTNVGILHLCPGDDNAFGDYVFIHGYNEAAGLKIHANGQIQFTSTPTLSGTAPTDNLILGTNNNEALVIQTDKGSTSVGMENANYNHIRTDAISGSYFSKRIIIDNQVDNPDEFAHNKSVVQSYDTNLFLYDHAGKSYIEIKDTEIDMYADSVQVLDIGKGSTGVSISGDGTHTRSNPLGITGSNIVSRLQVKGTHGGSIDSGTSDSELCLLDVVGTSQGDALIHFGQSSAAGGFIFYRGNTTSDGKFAELPDSDTIYFGSNAHTGNGVQPVMSYKYNGQDTNFHGDVGIGLSTDGGHENPSYKLQVKAGSSNEIAEFRSDNEDAYIRISQQHDTTGAAGVLYINTSGNQVFSGYHDSRAKFVYATGAGSTNGIIIDSSGQVGINENTPIGQLHLANKVSSLIIDQGGAVTANSVTGSNHGGGYADAPAIVIKSFTEGTFNSEGTNFVGGGGVRFLDNDTTKFYEICNIDDRLCFGHSNGGSSDSFALKGFISTEFVEEIQFTGQHMSRPVGGTTSPFENKVGYIVISNGSYDNINHDNEPTINESLPLVSLSNQINDKRVFGVISSYEDDNGGMRVGGYGGFKTVSDYSSGDSRLVINSLGEGAIMVSNYNGNLENGDYITTSPLEGLGMKQDDDLLHNYTVAKITQDEDFSSGTTNITYNGQTYKFKFVGCTYHCG